MIDVSIGRLIGGIRDTNLLQTDFPINTRNWKMLEEREVLLRELGRMDTVHDAPFTEVDRTVLNNSTGTQRLVWGFSGFAEYRVGPDLYELVESLVVT